MERIARGSAVGIAFILALAVIMAKGICWAAQPSEVFLEAETVAYNEKGSLATAEGNALLRYGAIRIYADSIDFDIASQEALAKALPGKSVSIISGTQKLYGESLFYHLPTEEGVLEGAKGEMPAGVGQLFVWGEKLEFAPTEKAAEKGWISSKSARRIKEKVTIGKWSDIELTTCPEKNPHYRVVTKKLTIIPGKSIVAKKPKVYIGKSYLFTYPFDYVVSLNKLESELMPSIVYDSDKGVGLGYSGPIVWEDGGAHVGAVFWTKNNMEWTVSAHQNLDFLGLDNASFFGDLEYSWEETTDEETFRPSWGVKGSWNGWSAKVWWSQREALNIEKGGGEIYKNLLYREPEIYIYSPSWPLMSWVNTKWRLVGTYGSYEERRGRRTLEADRSGLGIIVSGVGNPAPIRPFWTSSYWHYSYDGGDDEQKIAWLSLGAGYKLGFLDMRTAYRRRWVDGRSPMRWDNYGELEELYQQFAFPIGRDLSLTVRGAYNIRTEKWFERAYILTYDTSDCLKWQLFYRDDLSRTNDDWVSMKLIINAFPDKPMALGDKNLSNPFPF